MGFFDSLFGGGGLSGADIQQANALLTQRQQQAEIKARADAEALARHNLDLVEQQRLQYEADEAARQGRGGTAAAITSTDPTGTRQAASSALSALLPEGFDVSRLPDTLTDPFEESARAGQRGKADELIANMLKRGTVTETGAASGRQLLDTQDPTVRSRLNEIGANILARGRGSLRDIATQGQTAASALGVGDPFDPAAYGAQIDQSVAGFTGGLPTEFAGAVPAGLYDISGLESTTGAADSPRNISYDPYAVEGGKLSTGLDETETAPPPEKKRKVSVF